MCQESPSSMDKQHRGDMADARANRDGDFWLQFKTKIETQVSIKIK